MSDIACFGEPVCSCSLKQGIRDGFLLEASPTIGDNARRRLLDALVNELAESATKIEHAA